MITVDRFKKKGFRDITLLYGSLGSFTYKTEFQCSTKWVETANEAHEIKAIIWKIPSLNNYDVMMMQS